MPTLHARIRAARIGLGLGQQDLASAAALSISSVKRLEAGKDVAISKLVASQDALRNIGADFLEREGRLGVSFSASSHATAGTRFRAMREALGLDQEEFARLAGQSLRTLRNIETDNLSVGDGARTAVEGLLETLGVNLSPGGKDPGFLLPTYERLSGRLARIRRSMAGGNPSPES